MSGILDKFHVEHGLHGTRVLARSQPLTAFCSNEREVDEAVEALKSDLDACAREMKRLIEVNSRGAFFEGWAADV